jgi:hypothetical protein
MDGESGNLMITVPAGIEKHLVLPVLLGIQYVVAACMHPLKNRELVLDQITYNNNNIAFYPKRVGVGIMIKSPLGKKTNQERR